MNSAREINRRPLTPAMRQYQEIKAANPDAIVFFRMGDFYEMFYDDAILASRLLGIALTSRTKEKDIPMCGVPHHSARSYIGRLVREGYSVAVCEQLEKPGDAAGAVIERAVTSIITPGIAFDDELLEPKSNNFIASVYFGSHAFGLSYMDASTAEFRVSQFSDVTSLYDELKRLKPREVVAPDGASEGLKPVEQVAQKITEIAKFDFDRVNALEKMTEHFRVSSLDGFGCSGMDEGLRAAGALIKYVKHTQKSDLKHVTKITPYHTGDYLLIDHSTRRNLEIIENARAGQRAGTLLDVLDKTCTAMGGRLLKSWLLYPLKNADGINARLDAVEELVKRGGDIDAIKGLLGAVYDMERLIVRLSMNNSGPKDLVCLKESLQKIPEIKGIVSTFSSALLTGIAASLDDVAPASALIETAISNAPPPGIRDAGVIKEGYSLELDELREMRSNGKDRITALEAAERAASGINSLKIGYNRVFGYYIEITNSHLSNVPANYIRKQTLVNAERFVTPTLKEWEEKILTAEEKSLELEERLFKEVREIVVRYSKRVHVTATALAFLDVLLSLSSSAIEMNYRRPGVHEGDRIVIEGGRHPVIDAQVRDFVPNDLKMDSGSRIHIITGPNMAGKSTYLRQNALIVLMAQTGSFVPAESADIGIVDRIFTRVGASDDISRGQSTFMVEMNETANIINNATSKSLIILDEIGRGTSTFDGLSIAWSVVEYLHDNAKLKPKTLFATHYHELTELSLTKESVKNYNMAVREWGGKIIFLRKVVPGGSSRSYGIQVARLAGLPVPLIERAMEILKNLETGEFNESGMPRIAVNRGSADKGARLSLSSELDVIEKELRSVDSNSITPIEALVLLNRLKGYLKD